jgi:hypothetical protein
MNQGAVSAAPLWALAARRTQVNPGGIIGIPWVASPSEGTEKARRCPSGATDDPGHRGGTGGARGGISSAPSMWVTKVIIGSHCIASAVSYEVDRS